MIVIDYRDKRPLYEQVAEKLAQLIICGALESNAKLPSVRTLAMELSINPNTIQRAYMQLEQDGYIYTIVGRGNYVTDAHEWQKGYRSLATKELQEALQKYRGTILLVSHDIDFVRAVATSVLEITREGIRQFPGGYDYYCEKKEEAGRKEDGRAVREEVRKEARKEEGEALSKKELRQQRAAERAKIAPQVKELKRRVETAEAKIDELQKCLEEVSAELFNPKPDTDFAEANRKVRTLQFEIDRYTADWEEAATELERLQQGS